MNAHTTTKIFETDDYFVAHLDNGGARFMFIGVHGLSVPANHALYAEVISLTAETAEEFHNKLIESGYFI